MSVVTAPAVPLPTSLTAAACAFAAVSPVTAFSASSCAAVPCAGPLNAGGVEGVAAGAVVVAVVVELEFAAPAIAEPPIASAATATTPARILLRLVNIVASFRLPGQPGFTDQGSGRAVGGWLEAPQKGLSVPA